MEKNNNIEKIPFYEYLDIIDSHTKLNAIQRKGNLDGEYSWWILIKELKHKVNMNVYIENSNYLFELQNIILTLSINELSFYIYQKEKIYKEIEIINKKSNFYNQNDGLINNIKNDVDLEITGEKIQSDNNIYQNVKLPINIKIKEFYSKTLSLYLPEKEYLYITKYMKNILYSKKIL